MVCFPCKPRLGAKVVEEKEVPIHDFCELGRTTLTSQPECFLKKSRFDYRTRIDTKLILEVEIQVENIWRVFGIWWTIVVLRKVK
jgi:hypothetical protein